MGGNVAGNSNQNLTPRHALTPFPVLLLASLKHLIGMELGVLAQHRARKRGDQQLHRVTDHEITGNEAPSRLNGSLAIERSEDPAAHGLRFAAVALEVEDGETLTVAGRPAQRAVMRGSLDGAPVVNDPARFRS